MENASHREAQRKHETAQFFSQSQDFTDAWHKHFDEEGTAISGQITYSGCVVILASNALRRFKDDLDCLPKHWKHCGQQYGGHSVGEILVASANGFRHEDEWVKTRPMKPHQLKSAAKLLSALGSAKMAAQEPSHPGRCQEVITLLGDGRGFEGFSQAVFRFAHDIAIECRRVRGGKSSSTGGTSQHPPT